MGSLEVHAFGDPSALAAAAADAWVTRLQERDRALPYGVALAGGRIVKAFFDAIVAAAEGELTLFENVHFFWGDERCVPPMDPESNFAIAEKHLFIPLSIPRQQLHRIHGEVDEQYAANEAEAELCRIMPMNNVGQPVLDQVFLGLGEDGHVASLFPGESPAVMESPRVYRPVVASKPPPKRITIGYPALAAAQEVWILASGSGKETAFAKFRAGDDSLPASRIVASRERTVVYEDISHRKNI